MTARDRLPKVDGQDVEAVHLAARDALAHARAGQGPVFLLCETERLTGHYIGDPQVYRARPTLATKAPTGAERRNR